MSKLSTAMASNYMYMKKYHEVVKKYSKTEHVHLLYSIMEDTQAIVVMTTTLLLYNTN